MAASAVRTVRAISVWFVLTAAVAVPITAAAASPLLAWREPVYVIAGIAGVVALCLTLFQPLLVGGYLPGLPALRGRNVHRTTGMVLVAVVVVHVAGLWITSPPDVVDALTFRSPTPFSFWGVISMWAVFAAVLLVVLRRRLHLRPRTWRNAHTLLAIVIVVGGIVHAMLIEGTMELVSKTALCGLVLVATAKTVFDLRVRAKRTPSS